MNERIGMFLGNPPLVALSLLVLTGIITCIAIVISYVRIKHLQQGKNGFTKVSSESEAPEVQPSDAERIIFLLNLVENKLDVPYEYDVTTTLMYVIQILDYESKRAIILYDGDYPSPYERIYLDRSDNTFLIGMRIVYVYYEYNRSILLKAYYLINEDGTRTLLKTISMS